MDEQQEQEWLAQIAGGADPLTELAAVPRDEKPNGPCKPTGCLGTVLVILCLIWAALTLL
jgi:hypothetical protein